MLNLIEQAIVRAWIQGVALETYTQDLPVGKHPNALLAELLQRLALKARRIHADDCDFFSRPRQTNASWQAEALTKLHELVVRADLSPTPQQPLSYWVDEHTSATLAAAGLETIEQWLDWRCGQGKSWWQLIPALGLRYAQQLEQSLNDLLPDEYAQALAAAVPVIVYQTDVVPLPSLLLPMDCDGSQGLYRVQGECFIPADNDLQAITCWLARFPATSHSHRAYQREAERLLLWAILEKQKPLSSLNTVDLADYRRFLQDPQPAARWIGPNRPKSSPAWKPFSGPLSLRSIHHSETIISHLFKFLVDHAYLRFNPCLNLPKLRNPEGQARFNVHRSLSKSQWEFICSFLEQQVEAASGVALQRWIRLRLIVRLLYATGLRLHELVQAKVGDLLQLEREGQRQHWLCVLGKGQKQREVPLPPKTYRLMCDTYPLLTEQSFSQVPANYPLIPALRGSSAQALTPKAIYSALKAFFQQASTELAKTDPSSAAILEQASTHWLRHTHGTHAVDLNIPLTVIRDNLGHSSIAVTSQYVHADKDKRHDDMLKLEDA